MFKKLLAFVLCVAMLAGCGKAGNGLPASSSEPEVQDEPVYTYKDPDPDMVLATSPYGDVTYKDYRLYIDISENIARYNARQNAAMAAVLEYDLKKMGIEIDEDAFNAQADSSVEVMKNYFEDFESELGQLSEIAGLTEEQTVDAIKFGFRSEFLVEKMGAAIEEKAAKEYNPPAAPMNDSGEPSADFELIKQQGIYDLAARMMEQYSKEMNNRLSFDKDDVLVTVDGEDIAYFDGASNFIAYSAAASRLDTVSFIQQGELMLRALEEKGIKIDVDAINAEHDEYIKSLKGEEEQLKRLIDLCAPLGAGADDYFEALRRPLILETAVNRYYQMVDEEYAKLVEQNTNDSGDPTGSIPSPDQYYVDGMKALMQGSELVNISGK